MLGRYVLAGWWSRVGAQLIDGIIIGVGALILFLPIGAAVGAGFADDSDAGLRRGDPRAAPVGAVRHARGAALRADA